MARVDPVFEIRFDVENMKIIVDLLEGVDVDDS